MMAVGVMMLIYVAELRRNVFVWLLVVGGVFFIAMSLWFYRSDSSDNPFSIQNKSDDES